MPKTNPKYAVFAAQLTNLLADALQNKDSENYIEVKEEDLTEFIHALATVMPAHFYSKITGDCVDNLGFNHIANRLCFQFGTKKN